MEKEYLEQFTKEELIDFLGDLLDEMITDGYRYRNQAVEVEDDILANYDDSYGADLITKANKYKAIIVLEAIKKNEKPKDNITFNWSEEDIDLVRDEIKKVDVDWGNGIINVLIQPKKSIEYIELDVRITKSGINFDTNCTVECNGIKTWGNHTYIKNK